jgi:hypothetical protein
MDLIVIVELVVVIAEREREMPSMGFHTRQMMRELSLTRKRLEGTEKNVRRIW